MLQTDVVYVSFKRLRWCGSPGCVDGPQADGPYAVGPVGHVGSPHTFKRHFESPFQMDLHVQSAPSEVPPPPSAYSARHAVRETAAH